MVWRRGRGIGRIASRMLCERCRWVVIPSEVDETKRDEQCSVDRRQRQWSKFAESPDETRVVYAANLVREHGRVESAASLAAADERLVGIESRLRSRVHGIYDGCG